MITIATLTTMLTRVLTITILNSNVTRFELSFLQYDCDYDDDPSVNQAQRLG